MGSHRLLIVVIVIMFPAVCFVGNAACSCAHRFPVLQDFYDATNGAEWVRPWDMTAVDAPCGFEGVTCGAANDITIIELTNRGLRGTLPPSLSQLSGLLKFQADSNALNGGLPPEFSSWTVIEEINLSRNSLSGTLPHEYSVLSHLTHFIIFFNMIVGTLPAEYSRCTNFKQFDAHHNQISGTLPPEYSSWTNFDSLALPANKLTGTLPSAYSAWTRLNWFDVSSNQLDGTLPQEYAAWTKLGAVFSVAFNQLRGTLPSSYASWGFLSRVDVSRNKLDGTLPPEYSSWTKLRSFAAVSNSFTGTLHASYSAWVLTTSFDVSGNKLDGTLPQQYGSWTAITTFDVGDNAFTGSLPPTYSAWQHLTTFFAPNNNLEGTLPPEYSAWLSVELFHIPNNKLSGPLPPEYSAWTKLRSFSALANSLTGTLPAAYSAWVPAYFDVSINDLDGTLPPEYSSWTAINVFAAGVNALRGSLPPVYSAWRNVETFDVGNNTIEGMLPPEYSAWATLRSFSALANSLTGTLHGAYSAWALTHFDVSRNSLNGTLPPEYSSWTKLIVFDTSSNALTGSLPPNYSTWQSIDTFDVGKNKIQGTLPPEYSSWTRVREFDASENELFGTLPSVFSSWTAIRIFGVNSNNFSGLLPPSFGKWIQMAFFFVKRNAFVGTLPVEYHLMSALIIFDASVNMISGSIPVQYTSWNEIVELHLNGNNLSGTIGDVVFGGWSNVRMISLSRNAMTGTVPPKLLALPTLESLFLSSNFFVGPLPKLPTSATSFLLLDLQNNTGLVGTLPFRSMIVTVCGTGVCPTASLPLQYCPPPEVVEGVLFALNKLDRASLLLGLASFASRCVPTGNATASTVRPTNATIVAEESSPNSPNTLSYSVGTTVTYLSSVIGGASGGAVRGGIPNLQRALYALRLALACSSDVVNVSSTMFSDLSDMPLGCRSPLDRESAAGATIGNAVLVVVVSVCLHLLALLRNRKLRDTTCWVALQVVPASLLPGSLAVAYGTQLQPSIGAAAATFASSARTVQSITCGVALLLLWLAFPLYCSYRVLVTCRHKDGQFTLISTLAGEHRRRHTSRRHQTRCVGRLALHIRQLREYLLNPRTTWKVPLASPHRGVAAFVLEHLEPVIGAYTKRREWYFVVEWSLVAVGGVVTGVAEAVAADGDACSAAEWATWCMVVIGATQIAATLALRPFSVRFEMLSSVLVGALTLLSLVLLLIDAEDAAQVTVSLSGILALLVMAIMLMNTAENRCSSQRRKQQEAASDSQAPEIDLTAPALKILPEMHRRRAENTLVKIQCATNASNDADEQRKEQLRVLIELACSCVHDL
ncbi:GP46-like surface antigen, putative [Bodo saltans]|uniref:GP46-like surface antigen, putative n=1 Tax=Bodo saltans TaxID=75058 RepID=A0A0S4KEL3_BODSA|nr:GP46-like surface antigen, putative [Bodo saltans]|eukprot:CUI13277.1 GP46-like surface antigen, putative [Bodo saltans]